MALTLKKADQTPAHNPSDGPGPGQNWESWALATPKVTVVSCLHELCEPGSARYKQVTAIIEMRTAAESQRYSRLAIWISAFSLLVSVAFGVVTVFHLVK